LATLLLTPAMAAAEAVTRESHPIPSMRSLTRGPLEAEFAELEARIPGFAGWHFDANGNVVVSLKEVSRKEEALAQVAPRAEARRDQRGPHIAADAKLRYEARQARYSFLELAAYRASVQQNFPGGITRFDVDEVKNVLALGVAEKEDVGRIRAFVTRLGIPADAVTIDVAQPAKTRAHLFQYHRPLRGGSQIMFRNRYNQQSVCTLGVNGVYFNDSNYKGFITASHCTQYPWSYAGNNAGQGSLATADLVADEYDDPYYWDHAYADFCPVDTPLSGGWATVVGCRWSDAAFYRYRSSVYSTA
jgi:hypothetical protein